MKIKTGLKNIIGAIIILAAFATPSIAAATCYTESNFAAGPIAGSVNIPSSKGDYSFDGGFESSQNISYQDGNLALADPTQDGEIVGSPINIKANIGSGSFQLYNLAVYFANDYPLMSNSIDEISVQYRVDMGDWKTAEQVAGQKDYQLFRQDCGYPASNPEHKGYMSCTPDTSSYSRAGSTMQYKINWRASNPPRATLNQIRSITMCGEKSTIKVSSTGTDSTAIASRVATTTVLKLDSPTLLQINNFKINESPAVNIKEHEDVIFAGRTYANNTVKLYLSNGVAFEAIANSLGNWTYGLNGLDKGEYNLEAETVNAEGATSGKSELYKFTISAADIAPVASAAVSRPPQKSFPTWAYYVLGAAGLLVIAGAVYKFKLYKVKLNLPIKPALFSMKPNWLLLRAFILIILITAAVSTFAYIRSADSKKMAKLAYISGNYLLASSLYQQASQVPVNFDRQLEADLVDAKSKAGEESMIDKGLALLNAPLSTESCGDIQKYLGVTPRDHLKYKKTREGLLKCRLFSTTSALNELYPEATKDPEKVIVAINGGSATNSSSTGGYTPGRSAPGIIPGTTCSSSGEVWNGFCLVGTEEWRAKMKEIINIIAAVSAERYKVVQDHARIIYQFKDDVNEVSDPTRSNPYPLGRSSCREIIYMRLTERADGQLYTPSMNRFAFVLAHEADHGELEPNGCTVGNFDAVHQEMWDRWERVFQEQLNAYFATH